MKIEKKVLTEALRVLGKIVSQTSPGAVLRQVRFLGCGDTEPLLRNVPLGKRGALH